MQQDNTNNAAQSSAPKKAQLGRGAQVASMIAGALIGLVALIYLLGCVYYYDRFWPNTKIGDANLSNMTEADAVSTLDQVSRSRTVAV